MAYIESLNRNTKKYFNVLCEEKWPAFINKYIETQEMQRLSGIGFFCGMDYHNVDSIKPRYWYSRLDHSVACALITWNKTWDEAQTLSALFHDLGTPAFSHAVDFMLGDSNSQTTSEKEIIDIVGNSNMIKEYLERDKIKLEDVVDSKKYPIVDNETPKLCVDRLEGILSTGLIWGKYWNVTEIKEIYDTVYALEFDKKKRMTSVDFGTELGLVGRYPERFFKGIIKYSILLQSKEDKFCMQLLGDILGALVKKDVIKQGDLYKLSEAQIIDVINNSSASGLWDDFINLSEVLRVKRKDDYNYYCQVSVKRRFCDPLIVAPLGVERLSLVSQEAIDETQVFLDILKSEENTYITASLSENTIKTLKKHY